MQASIIEMIQTAHISLQILAMSKSVETKTNQCALILRRARPFLPLNFFSAKQTRTSQSSTATRSVRPVSRPAVRLSAAGEGGSRVYHLNPQPLFQ